MVKSNQNESARPSCENCKNRLPAEANYCPQCGQRVKESVWSIRGFFADVFENYLALDSKIGHTLKPFLFYPGLLTREYIAGRRAHYVRPIRLYLFTSIVFFFLLAAMVKSFERPGVNLIYKSPEEEALDTQERRDSLFKKLPGLNPIKPAWTPENSMVLVKPPIDSLPDPEFDIDIAIGNRSTSLDSIIQLANDLKLSEEEVVDQIHISESDLSTMEREILIRLIRIYRTNIHDIYQLIIRNVPFMMFILVPLFALLLKLAYVRRKKWRFLHHVIHSLHLHAFFYLLGMVIVVVYWIPFFPGFVRNIMLILAIIGFNVYWWRSLRYVYQRSFWKTSLTYLLLIIIYFMLSLLALLSEILISLYLL